MNSWEICCSPGLAPWRPAARMPSTEISVLVGSFILRRLRLGPCFGDLLEVPGRDVLRDEAKPRTVLPAAVWQRVAAHVLLRPSVHHRVEAGVAVGPLD